jgi:hypothetical protein
LRLEPDAAPVIFRQVLAAGLSRAILHVQIERGGVLELGAYDNFHLGCVVTGPGVSVGLLSELRTAGVIRGFRVAFTADKPDVRSVASPDPTE